MAARPNTTLHGINPNMGKTGPESRMNKPLRLNFKFGTSTYCLGDVRHLSNNPKHDG